MKERKADRRTDRKKNEMDAHNKSYDWRRYTRVTIG